MNKLEKAIEYADKLWKQQPNQLGVMPDMGNEFMWLVEFMMEREAELETLKKDVARYFELISKCPIWTLYENNEFHKLDEKLSKVGKEE